MTIWNRITVTITRAAEDAVSDLLVSAGAAGVEIIDSVDYLAHEDHFGEVMPPIALSELVEVRAYYPDHLPIVELLADIKHKIAALSDAFDLTGLVVATNQLQEADWADAWKKYFEPARVTHDLTIVPSWTTDYQALPSEKLIRLDPGMAFGTGMHPTTRMSLYALEQILRGGETVLDVGTGSGVLSIASVLLGAQEVFAYDIDEVAVRVARENIALNTNMGKIHVTANNLLENIGQATDVIVANILADILVQMTADAYRLIKPEGYLIMSGIIADKVAMVVANAEAAGFFLETQMIQGEWHCVIFKKTGNRAALVAG